MRKVNRRNVFLVLTGILVVTALILGVLLVQQKGIQKEERTVQKQQEEELQKHREEAEKKEKQMKELSKRVEELEQELENIQQENEALKAAAAHEAKPEAREGTISSSSGDSIFSRKDNGYVVVIDAGHQANGGDSAQEPIGPGAAETKARDTGGTQGVSGCPEYELNLIMALKLEKELTDRGYTVILTRESNDVNLGNVERASVANDNDADVFLRIHANSDGDSSVYGALTMATSTSNPYVSPDLSGQSQTFSQILIDAFCEATGAYNRGVMITDSMSGLNWSQVPCSIIEMGFMSNPEEDASMQTEEYQERMTQGMANGIDRYLGVQ